MSKIIYKQLNEVAKYRNDRIRIELLTETSYISTENMIQDRGGVTIATSIPESNTVSKFDKSDILLSNIRPYFKKIWHANRIGGCSNDVLVVKPQKNINPRFLYYVLSDSNFFNYATVTSKGTKMPRGCKQAIMKYLVPDFDLSTQTRIADVLSTYDKLIENNNRRIELLEKAAQELYKEWFVRFRFPNHENTKFVNGLPEGWEIRRIHEFCHVTDGTHDTPKPAEQGVPLVTGRCINNGFIDFDSAYLISVEDHKKIMKRSGLRTGDIIFSNIGTVGSMCLVDYYREFSVKNVIIFKPENNIISNYLFYLLANPTSQEIFSSQTNGASQQFVGLTFMRRFKIIVPNNSVLTSFSQKVNSIVKLKQNIFAQNQNLKKQRDLLLPRLMSGRLEV